MQFFELRSVPVDVLLRALAISNVMYHHAHFLNPPENDLWLSGGMAFLLMLSGMNLARFSMDRADTDELRKSIAVFTRRVFVPSLLAILFSFLVRRQFGWDELLFFQNLITPTRSISLFPVFYVQVLLQMVLGLYLLVLVPLIAKAVILFPGRSVMLFFIVALFARLLGPVIFGHEPPFLMPHLLLWNFALGFVVYHFGRASDAPPRPAMKLVALVCVWTAASLIFGPRILRFWWVALGGSLLIFVREVRVPAIVANLVVVVSGATFAIFFTHVFWQYGFAEGYRRLVDADGQPGVLMVFLFGMIMSVGGWVAYTGFIRAYRAMPPSTWVTRRERHSPVGEVRGTPSALARP
jgi:hypothetical protein